MDSVIPKRNLPEHRVDPLSVSVWFLCELPARHLTVSPLWGHLINSGAQFTCLGSTCLPSPVTMPYTEGIYII